MGTCRENADVFYYLFKRYPSGRWMGRKLLTKHFWKSPYLWQDSFWTYFNRLIGCRLGHGNIQEIDKDNGKIGKFCFNCYREVVEKL